MIIFPPFDAPEKWRAVDDRIRGGSSTSHLEPIRHGKNDSRSEGVRFFGELGMSRSKRGYRRKTIRRLMFWLLPSDFKTLGGAGFASQAYAFTEALKLPASDYTGIHLRLLTGSGTSNADANQQGTGEQPPGRHLDYTLVLKTGVPPLRPDGRRESTVNYEYTFSYPTESSTSNGGLDHSISWKEFGVTYRGRRIEEGDENYQPLDPGRGITEISFMCRSGFGEQEGPYELLVESLESIEARKVSSSEKECTESQTEHSTVSEKKGPSGQAEAYYVPLGEQSEEDKTWMRVALDMVSNRFDFTTLSSLLQIPSSLRA
jgi:hypothetical protein